MAVSVRNIESAHFERCRSRRGAVTSMESRTLAGLQRCQACKGHHVPAKITESVAGGVTGFSSGISPESSKVDILEFSPAFPFKGSGTG
ncbi:hypothetical protein NDU88_007118 [Pleurodeles waltl]|uniref:Uncharacterized protein n=1 Tax=Pleurodeles waltl TaxID=8319 RepID=A0AAV7U0J7_PLEWA|nr:hypothetical protein NDU88_007118 [Pleurodeles waltl]